MLDWLKRVFGSSPGSGDEHGEARADVYEADKLDPFNPFPETVRLEIRDIFDLHTFHPRDVKRVVEEYLLEARRAGFRSVRIIHGKGKGVQRKLVQSILARTGFVESWTDAPPHAGGLGATVAHLAPLAEDADDVDEEQASASSPL